MTHVTMFSFLPAHIPTLSNKFHSTEVFSIPLQSVDLSYYLNTTQYYAPPTALHGNHTVLTPLYCYYNRTFLTPRYVMPFKLSRYLQSKQKHLNIQHDKR